MSTAQPNGSALHTFDWRIAEEQGVAVVQFQSIYQPARWHSLGEASEVMSREAAGLYRNDAWEPERRTWKKKKGKTKAHWQVVPAHWVVKTFCNPAAELSLQQIAESCGLRRLAPESWFVTAPNPVLHPQFGPGVVRATDGVHALWWSGLSPGCDWAMVQKSNLVGPVTSTPVHPENYPWARGIEGQQSSPARSTRVRKTLKPKKSSALEAALALLEEFEEE